MKSQSEHENEEAANSSAEIDDIVRRARDVLLALHRTNPRKLEAWGFAVDDTAQPGKPAPPPSQK